MVKNGSKSRANFGRHPGAGVGDAQAEVGIGGGGVASELLGRGPAALGGEPQHTAARHRVAGVDAEVEQHLAEKPGIREGEAVERLHVGLEGDAWVDGAAQQFDNLRNEPSHIDRGDEHLVAAGEA